MVGGKKISFAALGPCRNEYEAWARGVSFQLVALERGAGRMLSFVAGPCRNEAEA